MIVAILDRGIDWRHPDFIREDGTTRILAILDQSGQSYCQSSNPSALEFDRADIQAALDTGADLGTRDAVGHGTATAGLAAGNGRAFANGKYRGIAPEADLLIVKMASEGAPAHGGHAAESPFVACIDEALDWVDAKIDELGQPCVALINSGTQWGPIDGTSAVSRKIEEVFGEDRPGRVCVLPSGDEGSLPNHARTSFAPGAPAVFKFVKADTTAVFTQLWFTGDAPAEVLVKFTSGASSGPVAPGGFAFTDGIQIRHYLPGTEGYPWLSTNGERSVRIWITGQSGPGSIRVRSLGADGGTVDAYGDLAGPNLTSILRFQDHLTPGRLTDYASTRSAIIVGNEVLRTQWKSITGATIPAAGEGQVGQLWTKSSAGPTRDGRLLAVDLTAPGQNVFAAYGQDSYWTTFDDVLVQDGGRWYGRLAGTSGSAPIVTGAVALMLERNPTLTAADVRTILRATARTNANTGPTPNPEWGWGRLDVYSSVSQAAPSLSVSQASLSLSSGGERTLTLSPGPALAGRLYLLAGTTSGSVPGNQVGLSTIPLNPDAYLDLTVLSPNQPPLLGGFGLLDALGEATATFRLPPGSDPTLAGVQLDHAFVTFSDAAGGIEHVSNAVGLELAP